jgi:hypothetical protein
VLTPHIASHVRKKFYQFGAHVRVIEAPVYGREAVEIEPTPLPGADPRAASDEAGPD